MDGPVRSQAGPNDAPAAVDRLFGAALVGLAVGGVVGGVLGASLGTGALTVPGLGFLGAGGAGVAGVIGAAALGAPLALAGGLWGIQRGAENAAVQDPGAGAGSDDSPMESGGGGLYGLVQHLPTYGAIALLVFMGYTVATILLRTFQVGASSDQGGRVTWQLKNVTRVGGPIDAETAPAVLAVAYPAADSAGRPRERIAMPADWRAALALTPLIADPTRAALLIENADGERGGDSVTQAPVGDPAAVAAAVDARLTAGSPVGSAFGSARSTVVLVVASDGDARWALPAGAYAARTGTSVLFVTRSGVPSPTAAALARRGGRVSIYVLGPDAVVPGAVVASLRRYGRLTRIGGDDVYDGAVHFAEFYDPTTGFGWGRTGTGPRAFASKNSLLVDGGRWQDAIAAAHLARRGKAGPLLFADDGRLPAAVEAYFWRQRPAFANTPEEGPYAHTTIVGSFQRVPYETQARVDYAQEIEQYMTLGDSAVSGFEGLMVAWMLFAVASAISVFVHAGRRVRGLMPMMRSAWTLFALLLGPLAVWMYIASYHRRPEMEHEGMTMWQRGRWGQAISATVMMFSFDMLLMCLAVFALAYRGFPIIRAEGPLSVLGSSMFLMMVGMYVIALVLMLLLFHGPMTMHERRIPSYWKAVVAGAPIMLATMTVESLGMMPTMWWQQMSFLPNMQMPTSDDFTMWATLYVSVFVSFLVVLPFNYWLVRRGTKRGSM